MAPGKQHKYPVDDEAPPAHLSGASPRTEERPSESCLEAKIRANRGP